jgi:hypothetical protein
MRHSATAPSSKETMSSSLPVSPVSTVWDPPRPITGCSSFWKRG